MSPPRSPLVFAAVGSVLTARGPGSVAFEAVARTVEWLEGDWRGIIENPRILGGEGGEPFRW